MNVLIIGGNATGMSAASRLRKNNPDAQITVLEKGDLVSFGACGLPYFVGDEFSDTSEMIARSLEAFQKINIKILLHHEAISIDHQAQSVSAYDHTSNKQLTFLYDKVVISTGAHPFIPPISGIDLSGIFTLTKMQDGIALKEALRAAKKVVIIGGGFIGLESAEAMLLQEKNVTIIENKSRVSERVFDPEMTIHLEQAIRDSGVNLQLEEMVQEFKGTDIIQQVITNKASYNADLVIIATGFIPSTKWCSNIGLDMLSNGAIVIDQYCQTNIPNIYAGGDCATVRHATFNQDTYIPLATSANKLGRLLGDILNNNKKKSFQGTLGSSALRFHNFQVGRTGLSEHELQSLKIDYSVNIITDYNHTSYVPDQKKLYIKLLYDKKSRVLLGGQICGQQDAVLRVDVLAAAIFKKMTVDELGMLDLIYAPPFSRTWDALNIAGNTSK